MTHGHVVRWLAAPGGATCGSMRCPRCRVRFNRANFFVALLLFGLFSLYKMPPAAPPTPPPTLPPTTPPPTTPPTACRLAVPVAQRAPGSPARRPQPAPELAPLRGACACRCPESCMLLTSLHVCLLNPRPVLRCFILTYDRAVRAAAAAPSTHANTITTASRPPVVGLSARQRSNYDSPTLRRNHCSAF